MVYNSNNNTIGKVTAGLANSQESVLEVISDYGESTFDRPKYLQQFFPDEQKRALAMGELKLIENEFEFRKKALEMARTVQIQGLKETCNQYLMNAKVQARKDSSSHLMKKLNELLKDMELITNEFFDSVTSRQKQIEKAPHPLLKQNLERDLEKDIIDFSNCKSSLIDNFKKIVNESV
jgi:hypothetical protein